MTRYLWKIASTYIIAMYLISLVDYMVDTNAPCKTLEDHLMSNFLTNILFVNECNHRIYNGILVKYYFRITVSIVSALLLLLT